MTTLQSIGADTVQVTPATNASVATTEAKNNGTVVIHSRCSLCNLSHRCCQLSSNGGILNLVSPTVDEPKTLAYHVLEGKYFATHAAKVKYHIASILRLCGLPPPEAERVALLLGDACVLGEITKSCPITLYENSAGEKFLTKEEAKNSSSPGVKITT